MTQEQPSPAKPNKAESARINGAKSRGAVTEEGKRNSANGNLRHGAYAKRVLLDGEDPGFYERFKQAFLDHFQPSDPFEFECVESMVTARWRIRRIESAETCIVNAALVDNKPQLERTYERIDIVHERAFAVESKISSLEPLMRIQERLHRVYDRNYKLLLNSRRKSGKPAPLSELPNPLAAPEPPHSAPEPVIQPTEPSPVSGKSPSILLQTILFLAIFALSLLGPATALAEIIIPAAFVTRSLCAGSAPLTNSHLNIQKKESL